MTLFPGRKGRQKTPIFWVPFPRGKKGKQKIPNIFWAFFPLGKKGMEMWQLVLMILALVLLFFMLAWYGALGQNLQVLFTKMGDLF